jgi:hypothetical protein
MDSSSTGRQVNPWARLMYDLRFIHLKGDKRGQAQAHKLILFVIAAAGIPTPTTPQAGYRNRRSILAQETCLNMTSLKKHLADLEKDQLLFSKAIGLNTPKLRWVNWSRVRVIAEAQRVDRDAWIGEHLDRDEGAPSLLWTPTNLHYENSMALRSSSIAPLDIPIDQPIVPPLDKPIVKPLDSQSESSASAHEGDEVGLLTDCIETHPWQECCQECCQFNDRDEVLGILRSGGSVRGFLDSASRRGSRY